MTFDRRRARWIAPIALSVAAVGGIAYAAIPDGAGTIHACYKKSGGALRVIDSTVTNCDKGETAIEWGQSGPPGAPGADGAPGISGYEIVTATETSTALGFFGGFNATCPAGKKVLGGGAVANTSEGGVQSGYAVLYDAPTGDNGWQATFDISNPFGTEFVMNVTAICATVAP